MSKKQEPEGYWEGPHGVLVPNSKEYVYDGEYTKFYKDGRIINDGHSCVIVIPTKDE
jgi:hypothetical protein